SDNDVDDSSDVDSSPPPPTHTAQPASTTLPPPPATSVKPSPPSAKPSPSKKSTGPLKKIDLGAAAHYGKTSSSSGSQPTSNNNHNTGKLAPPSADSSALSFDLLGELITPDATPPGKQSSNNINNGGGADFGDFEAAADVFSSNVQGNLVSSSQSVSNVNSGGDDFADFSSAFSSSNSNQSSKYTPLAQHSNADLLSGLGPVSTGTPSIMGTAGFNAQSSTASLIPDLIRDHSLNLSALLAFIHNQWPGPLTAQKLAALDAESPCRVVWFRDNYAKFLTNIVPPLLEHNNCELVLQKTLLIEDGNVFTLWGALFEILTELKTYHKPSRNRDRFLNVLDELVKNEAVFLSVLCRDVEVDCSDKDSTEEERKENSERLGEQVGKDARKDRCCHDRDNGVVGNQESDTLGGPSWVHDPHDKQQGRSALSPVIESTVYTVNELIVLLANLSSQVSNIVQLDLPDTFKHLHVEKLLLVHVCNAMRMSYQLFKQDPNRFHKLECYRDVEPVQIVDRGRSTTIPVNIYLMQNLFNKLLSNFPIMTGVHSSDETTLFVRKLLGLFELWIANDEDSFFLKTLQTLFTTLSKRSGEFLVTNLLKHVTDPRMCAKLCEPFFASDKHFEYLLSVKLVFQTSANVFDNETDVLIRNIIHVLMDVSDWKTNCDNKPTQDSKTSCNGPNNKSSGPNEKPENLSKSSEKEISENANAGRSLFSQVVFNILRLWSNHQVLIHSSVAQHAYLSKLLVNMIALNPSLVKPTDKLVLNGVMAHLKCTNEVLRTIGMITGDLIIGILNSNEINGITNSSGVEKPKTIGFDFEKVSPEGQAYVESLKQIVVNRSCEKVDKIKRDGIDSSGGQDVDSKHGNGEQSRLDRGRNAEGKQSKTNSLDEADEILSSLLEEFSIVKSVTECNEKTKTKKKKDEKENLDKGKDTEVHSLIEQMNEVRVADDEAYNSDDESNNSFLIDSDDEEEFIELDEDNELPNANQYNTMATKVPKYLRDLKEYLVQDRSKGGNGPENAADIWTATIRNAERIIREQLPLDDYHIGLELLNILITLDKEFYCEDFEQFRFDAMLAVVLVYPKQSGEHLCSQFHQFGHQYSVRQKMLILDTLAHGAHLLSSLQEDDTVTTGKTKSILISNKTSKPSQVKNETNEAANLKKDILGKVIWRSRKLDLKSDPSHDAGGCKIKVNNFANMVPWFFYPLIRGKTTKQDVFIPLKPSQSLSDNLDGLGNEFLGDDQELKRRQDNLKLLDEIEATLSLTRDGSVNKMGKLLDVRKPDGKDKSGAVQSNLLTLNSESNSRELSRRLDELLVIRLIRALSVIVLASQHSIHNVAICREMLEFLRALAGEGALSEELATSILSGTGAVLCSVSRTRINDLELDWVGKWCVRKMSESCERRIGEMARRVLSMYVSLCEEANGTRM
ncbi:hypothetical protein WDU94_002310, partial [Cyamophila willieti]